jgi:hypothetical protein
MGEVMTGRDYTILGGAVAAVIVFVIVFLPRIVVRGLPVNMTQSISDPKDRLSLENDRLKLRNEFRTTCVQLLAGLALIAGVLVTYRQSLAAQTALTSSLATSRKQLEIAQSVEERTNYDEAIKQLSDPDLAIRLASIHTLVHIAEANPDQQGVVADILGAFVRQRQPWPPPPDSPFPAEAALTSVPEMFYRASDVNEAIFRLGRGGIAESTFAVLSGDLRGTNFSGGEYSHAAFGGAHLGASSFEGADLREADLYSTDLTDAVLLDAKLCGADLRSAILTGATFEGATADEDTWWPSGFDAPSAGVVQASNSEECR